MAKNATEKKTPRRTTRQRNAPDRYGEYAAADSSGPAEPRGKRQKTGTTSHIQKAAEQQPSVTNDDEHVTPPAGNASKKRRRTPQPALPLTPHTSPAEASQAGSGSSAGIKRYFKTKLPDEDNAQADVSTSPTQPDPAVEDDVSSGEEESSGEETSKAAGKKAIRRAGNASGKKAVTDRSDTRPLPDGEPPVWALGRQALCEALPYYRANHSAAYCTDGTCLGFLLDGGGGLRSYMNSEIIITRAGGGAKTGEDGGTEQVKDQKADNPTVKAIMRNMKKNIAFAVIAGQKNDSCPVQLPHRYCVLGWFVVTKVWAEKELKGKRQSVTVIKYRFEKLHLNVRSWWIPKGSKETSPMIANPVAAPMRQCTGNCGQVQTQIYKQGWTCLIPECNEFHNIVTHMNNDKLTYSDEFLSERRTVRQIRLPKFKLVPTHYSGEDVGEDPRLRYARGSWKGFVCPECHICNQRRYWNRLQCLNEQCNYVTDTENPVLSHIALLPDHTTEVEGHANPNPECEAPITDSDEIFDNWVITTYQVTDNDFVTHFQANRYINAGIHASNEILIGVQKDSKLQLERYPREQSGDKGFLTNNYSRNCGLPYKYVVLVENSGFRDAADAVIHALHRLKWAGEKAVGGECKPFNELLTVGYMDKGEMKYHDDGEKDLGPTVASLSLGGPAVMTFRMKSKYFNGLTKGTGTYDPKAPVLNGAWKKAEREKFNETCDDGLKVKSQAFKDKVSNFYRDLGKRPAECPPLITLKLAHGDMVVQHGCDLQKYYEHQVVSEDMLRFAMTARHIDPDCENARGKQDLNDYNASAFPDYDGA